MGGTSRTKKPDAKKDQPDRSTSRSPKPNRTPVAEGDMREDEVPTPGESSVVVLGMAATPSAATASLFSLGSQAVQQQPAAGGNCVAFWPSAAPFSFMDQMQQMATQISTIAAIVAAIPQLLQVQATMATN
jgi:hypothetical protein